MAKKDDQPSIKVEPRPVDGKRNGFLAEEKHLDRSGLLRLGTWGLVAVGAVAFAVLADRSSMKLQRDEAAAADLARQSQQIQALVKESQGETRRLVAAIDTLNNDRDRLFARVTVLEEGLDSVTGSIQQQDSSRAPPQPSAHPAAAASLAPSPTPAPSLPQSAASNPVAQNPAPLPLPAPVAAPVATATPTPAAPEKPVADARPTEPPAKIAAIEAPKSSSAPQSVASSAPLVSQPTPAAAPAPRKESKSMIGPPSPAAQKSIEPPPAKAAATAPAPQLVASAAPEEKEKKTPDAVQQASAAIAVKRTEFGIDLGGANSVPGLRALWRGLLKTRANTSLMALQPIIVVREGNTGLGMQLRLVAGPFDDAAAAAKTCASLGERPCETTVYDGQRLMLKPGDEPAVANIEPAKSAPAIADSTRSEPEKLEADKTEAEKSASEKAVRRNYSRHRFYTKKLPVPPPPPPPPAPTAQEPPKPEPTTLSSFFNRRTQP
jgi:hypothetical protein